MPPLESLLEGGRLLAVAPHPDDESLAMGGLLQAARAAGAPVRVIFLTRGDDNPWPQRLIERRWRLGPADRERWGRRRTGEASRALAALGIPASDCVFCDFPDQQLTAHLLSGNDGAIGLLAAEVAAWRPTLIVAPSLCDLHPDHSAAAVMLRLALERAAGPAAPPRLLEYIIHPKGARASAGAGALPLTPQMHLRKRNAILCHESQVKYRAWHQLGHARGSEYYLPAGGESDGLAAGHPVRESRTEGDDLLLKLGLRARPGLGVFGPATLLLAVSRGGCLVAKAELPLPRRTRDAEFKVVQMEPAAPPAVHSARFTGNYKSGEVRLPLAPLGSFDRLYAKIERRYGFFDEAGWRPLT